MVFVHTGKGKDKKKMNCAVCGKENVSVSTDGGCAIMLAFCVGHDTNLLNNCYCKDCYETLVKPCFKAYSDATGLFIGGLDEASE